MSRFFLLALSSEFLALLRLQMLSPRHLPRVSPGLLSSTRTFSTSFFRLQDVQSQLLALKFDEKTNDQVLKFLEENNLKTLAQTMKDHKLAGVGFVANIQDLSQLSDKHKQEGETLSSSILKAQWTKPNPTLVAKVFSKNGAISNRGSHYYIRRFNYPHLRNTIINNPGFYLFQGPRRSGKSTLANQLIEALGNDFVFAKLATPDGGRLPNFALKLSSNEFSASPEVQKVAKKYLDPSVESNGFLDYLFRQDYGGKKLVLFWDEFDRADVALTLRRLDNVKDSLTSFGGVVCLGAINSTLVADGGISVFTKTYTHETLDFSLDETKYLFRQYNLEDPTAKVSNEVVERIQWETGGHAGLVNLCGAFIQEELGGECGLIEWQNSMAKLINFIASKTTYKAVMKPLKDDAEVVRLLRYLCGYEKRVLLDPSSEAQKRAQQYGLARMEKRDTKLYIVIESELIREVVRRYITRDHPAFTEMPLLPNNGRVDIPALLSAVVKAFHSQDLYKSSQSKMKQHEGFPDLLAPKAEVHQKETYRVLSGTFKEVDSWSVEDNVTPPGDEGSVAKGKDALDLLIRNKKLGGLRVGFELCASLATSRLRLRAKRPYPATRP